MCAWIAAWGCCHTERCRDEGALLRAAARHVQDQVGVSLPPDVPLLRLLDVHYSHPGAGMNHPDVHEVCRRCIHRTLLVC